MRTQDGEGHLHVHPTEAPRKARETLDIWHKKLQDIEVVIGSLVHREPGHLRQATARSCPTPATLCVWLTEQSLATFESICSSMKL